MKIRQKMQYVDEEETMEKGLRVTFWGTRGSIAAPYGDRMEFGGNTSCVSVDWAEGIAVFDGGTGIMGLGNRLKEAGGKDQAVHIFVSHLHMDHIIGLFMFPCLFCKGMAIEFYGPCEEGRTFRERFWSAMDHPYWPVTMGQTAAKITWHDTRDGDMWNLPGDVRVRVMSSSHPNGCVIYRLERKGQSVIYGLDCELGEEKGEFWAKYRQFAHNCNLLIFDGPYGREEYQAFKGFGHSFWQQGIKMAKECGAARLYISHHDWGKTDCDLKDMEKEARHEAGDWKGSVVFAREGECVCLGSPEEGSCLNSAKEQSVGVESYEK